VILVKTQQERFNPEPESEKNPAKDQETILEKNRSEARQDSINCTGYRSRRA